MALFGKARGEDAALAARYKHLLNVAKALASERDLKKVLTLAMDTIVQLTGAERAFVWLGSVDDGAVAVARNLDKEHVRNPGGKVSRSILARAFETGETVRTDNAALDEYMGATIRSLNFVAASNISMEEMIDAR
jgi:GAF domain-containing protein